MIRKLPDHLVNQIAAGEVVERPASVVKELVENAIDAGATQIDITLEDAGKSLIEVRDNGGGIPHAALRLAVERHATSKLDEAGLSQVSTRGFRGEALPSIASVSAFTLTSRTAAADSAWTLRNGVDGWQAARPAAGPIGTAVRVSQLFHRTPARLKFLRSDTAERAAIKQTLIDLALSAPTLALTLTEGAKTPLRIHGQGAQRLGQLMGADFVSAHRALDYTRGEITVALQAGLPTLNRATGAGLYFMVNGRPIMDTRLMGVVRAAYRDYVPKGRFPTLIAHITLPPALVDVNVHPAKTEVRFRDPSAVSAALMGALQTALGAGKYGDQGQSSSHLSQHLASRLQPSHQTARPSAVQAGLALASQAPFPAGQTETALPLHEAEARAGQPLGTPLALLHKTYILSQTIEGFCLIDMHAAHERLVYERLKAALREGAIPRQGLLVPQVITLAAEAAERLLTMADALAKLGLVIEAFDGAAVLVREVPALLAETADWHALLCDLAELSGQDAGGADLIEAKLHEALASLACYTSVRSGRQLNMAEMDALLRHMEATPASAQCNHGRPTSVKLSLGQLETLFERA